MPNGAEDPHRITRGYLQADGTPRFSETQRIWLLERDFDDNEKSDEVFKSEVRAELVAIRKLVSQRLNVLVGIGFSLLIAVVSVLITVVASSNG